MTYNYDGYNYLLRMEKGERLRDVMERFAAETKIAGAWVSGLGAAQDVTLGFYFLGTKEYKWRTFGGIREIAALQGNLAFDEQGKMMFHLHGVFADEQYQTVGGHVKDFVAGATVELFIHHDYERLQRKMDNEIGLQLLDLHHALPGATEA